MPYEPPVDEDSTPHNQGRNPFTTWSRRLQSSIRNLRPRASSEGPQNDRIDPNQLEGGLAHPSVFVSQHQDEKHVDEKDIADAPITNSHDHGQSATEPDSRGIYSHDEPSGTFSTHHVENLDSDQPDANTSKHRVRFLASNLFRTRTNGQEESGYVEDASVEHEAVAEEPPKYTEEARDLVRKFSLGGEAPVYTESSEGTGTQTPAVDRYLSDIDYVPAPKQYKPSIFGTILTSRLNDLQNATSQQRETNHRHSQPADYLDLARKLIPQDSKHGRARSWENSSPSSGTATPKKPKWYEKPGQGSPMANMLIQAGVSTSEPGLPKGVQNAPSRPRTPPLKPGNLISSAVDIIKNPTASHHSRHKTTNRKPKYDVVDEVADILARRKYLIKLCDAFMKNGAPTHRLEEYLASSARALSIDADFMYIPGAMMCTFIDNVLHTNSVELVRRREGCDLGRLKDVFDVYKCVVHDKYTAEEAIFELDSIQKRPEIYSTWFRILIFGLASVFCGPFSFDARPIDFPPIFLLGCALGFLQLKVVPRSEQFSNVFEVFACVLIAFIARGLGSIRWQGQYLFCFSATAQSSIAMILPGFLVLNSALELQGRSMVAGSVRMVYAIIYILFLGFGLLVGTTIFGLMKRDAVTDVTCNVPDWFSPATGHWKLIYARFVWVPLFAACIAIVYRAKWRQLPVMALIAVCGHQANFWISTQLSSNLQVANAVGAFVVGCLAHLYSRVFHGLAAASMLPAIYCQVPGGLAASGSLVAGVDSSNQIFGNSSSISVINNGTQGFIAAQQNPSSVYGGTIYNVGYGMVQVAIGISVGLYLSALVMYPYGKRRSGLFSF